MVCLHLISPHWHVITPPKEFTTRWIIRAAIPSGHLGFGAVCFYVFPSSGSTTIEPYNARPGAVRRCMNWKLTISSNFHSCFVVSNDTTRQAVLFNRELLGGKKRKTDALLTPELGKKSEMRCFEKRVSANTGSY